MAVNEWKSWLDTWKGSLDAKGSLDSKVRLDSKVWLDVPTFRVTILRFTILTVLVIASIAFFHDGSSNRVSAAPQSTVHHIRLPNSPIGWVYYKLPGASRELHVKGVGDVVVPSGVDVTLTLSGAATDMGLGFLLNVSPSQIRGLNMADLEVGDNDIKYLKNFRDIHKLELGGTNFTDSGARQLVSMFPDVNDASLARTRITAKSIPVIAKGWKSLFKLVLSGIKLGPNSLATLKSQKELNHLDLDMSDIADIDMVAVGQLLKMEELDVSGNPRITDKGVSCLTKLKLLARLDLMDTSITGASAPYLKVLPKLKKLRIRAAKLKKSDIAQLKKAVKGIVEDPADTLDMGLFEPIHDGYLERH